MEHYYTHFFKNTKQESKLTHSPSCHHLEEMIVKKHLTEFSLIIRLVYLWFASADWFPSSSEGVVPSQKKKKKKQISRDGFHDEPWKPREENPLMKLAPLSWN